LTYLLSSPPFPQLLPYLDERLNFARARQAVVEQTAILEGAFVEMTNGAEERHGIY
jgi:hypothetical protein